ncbi:MAG: hypothetical protein B7Z14_14920 [Bosea sp. 32-68-6]|nr:MAG: hypothetical protein B7Z14_14920 [Bosea sp. 32-68-6]
MWLSMNKPHQHMGERIRKARRATDLTQQQVSDALNVSVQSVSQWETGRTRPDADRLVRLADLIGVSFEYLTKGTLADDGTIPKPARWPARNGLSSRYAPLIKSKGEALGTVARLFDEDEPEIILSQFKPIGRIFAYELTEKDEAAPVYREGDIFIIDDGIGFRNGDIVLALDFDGDTFDFRQVRGVRLDALDHTIVDLRPLDGGEVTSSLDLDGEENRILGTVVEHRRLRSR